MPITSNVLWSQAISPYWPAIDPAQVHEWYLAVYADAYEWVEAPNVIGMSQFADGGIVGSKPYVSSGAYIDRMSDYCKSCAYKVKDKTGPDACPFNLLYWHFLTVTATVSRATRAWRTCTAPGTAWTTTAAKPCCAKPINSLKTFDDSQKSPHLWFRNTPAGGARPKGGKQMAWRVSASVQFELSVISAVASSSTPSVQLPLASARWHSGSCPRPAACP